MPKTTTSGVRKGTPKPAGLPAKVGMKSTGYAGNMGKATSAKNVGIMKVKKNG